MRIFLLGLAMMSVGCVAACTSGIDADEGVGSRVHVMRQAGDWSAVFVLDRDAPVWGFAHSAQMRDGKPQWRPEQWSVETPGVVLDRFGTRDLLRSVDGGPVPRIVRIRIKPASARVEASYSPALMFSDGSVALFSGQFDVFPATSVEVVRETQDDMNGAIPAAPPTIATWSDGGAPVLYRGKLERDPSSRGGDTYVLFGKARLVEYESLAAVVDPVMPDWIQRTIVEFAPQVTDYYARRLGVVLEHRPMVMASWNGPTPRMTSMGGSVLPGLIVATFEGEDVVVETDGLRSMVRWFIGHECAHFWLGQTVRYETERDFWITEGGADMTAIRGMAQLDLSYNAKGDMQARVDDCIERISGRSIVDAAGRGDMQSHYSCGAVFALVAEGVQKRRDGGDWFDFLRQLIAENLEDGLVTRAEWLAKLTDLSGDPALAEAIGVILDHGAAEPEVAIAALFARAGILHRLESEKVILL